MRRLAKSSSGPLARAWISSPSLARSRVCLVCERVHVHICMHFVRMPVRVCAKVPRDRDRDGDRDIHRDKDIHRDIHRDRDRGGDRTYTETKTYTETGTYTETETDTETQ